MKPYDILFSDEFENKILKLKKKDPALYRRLFKKIVLIAQSPYLGKPLRNVLKNKRRIHISHHDRVYQ